MPAQQSPGEGLTVNAYLVSSSEGQIARGSVVMFTTLNTVREITGAFGNQTSSAAILGVSAQFMAANAGSTAATINSSPNQMLMVYDAPGQRFVACDTTSGVIGTQLGQNKYYAILSSGCVGSTGTSVNGQSVMAISGVTSTAAGSLKILWLHPVENGIHSTVGAATAGSAVNVRKWICVLNPTVMTQGSTGLNTIVNTTS